MTTTPEYPLYCVDRGRDYDESQYLGPFETLEEAAQCAKQAWAEHCEPRDPDPNPEFSIRRCRRVDGRDVGVASLLEQLYEAVEEDVAAGPPRGVWADWENEISDIPDAAAAEQALRTFVTKHFRFSAYALEPLPKPEEAAS